MPLEMREPSVFGGWLPFAKPPNSSNREDRRMNIASALGFGRKVRYGIVSLGDISQEALMPGVKHTGNSEPVNSSASTGN